MALLDVAGQNEVESYLFDVEQQKTRCHEQYSWRESSALENIALRANIETGAELGETKNDSPHILPFLRREKKLHSVTGTKSRGLR